MRHVSSEFGSTLQPERPGSHYTFFGTPFFGFGRQQIRKLVSASPGGSEANVEKQRIDPISIALFVVVMEQKILNHKHKIISF
jgi:hypothetical protein